MLQSHPGVARTVEKYNLPSIHELVELYKLTARHTLEEYLPLVDKVVEYAFKREMDKTNGETTADLRNPNIGLEELGNRVYERLDKLMEKFVTNREATTLGDCIDILFFQQVLYI